MARKVITMVTCDLCAKSGKESEAEENIDVVVDGKAYAADVCAKHYQDMLGKITAVTDVMIQVKKPGRKAGDARPPAGSPATSNVESRAVRKWAESNGIDVPSRGRIPNAVLAQFLEANPN